jgi:hypothetical protein
MNIIDCFKNKKYGSSRKFINDLHAYEFHFESIKKRKNYINILEIGVQGGGSLWAWKEYFSDNIKNIVGIDIDSSCKNIEDPNSNVFVEIGDQMDVKFLNSINEKYGPFDIIIDDGGHYMSNHLVSFETLFPLMRNDSLYCIEDLHTAYWPRYRGQFPTISAKSPNTIKYLISLVDNLNARAQRNENADGLRNLNNYSDLDLNLNSIHFYESLTLIHKKNRDYLNQSHSSINF